MASSRATQRTARRHHRQLRVPSPATTTAGSRRSGNGRRRRQQGIQLDPSDAQVTVLARSLVPAIAEEKATPCRPRHQCRGERARRRPGSTVTSPQQAAPGRRKGPRPAGLAIASRRKPTAQRAAPASSVRQCPRRWRRDNEINTESAPVEDATNATVKASRRHPRAFTEANAGS